MKKLELLIPPPVVALISVFLIWIISLIFPGLSFDFIGRRFVVLALLIIGGMFGLGGILQFERKQTTMNPAKPQNSRILITKGIYAVSRNPMYMGILWGLIAYIIYLGNILSVLGAIFFVFYITEYQIKPEEKELHKKFGRLYRAYTKKVRRWI